MSRPPRRVRRGRPTRFGLAVLATLGLLAAVAGPLLAVPVRPALAAPGDWQAAWGSPMAWQYGTAVNATVRDVTIPSISGTALRVRISNVFSNSPLSIGAGSVGVRGANAALVAATVRPLSFSGRPATTIPPGGLIYSDPVPFPVVAGQPLLVSLYLPGVSPVTVHPCCTNGPVGSYATPNNVGNQVGDLSGARFTVASPWGRWVDAVDVQGSPVTGGIVVFGDSISDGFNTQLRWTDAFLSRLRTLPEAQRLAVVNEGITANALTDVPGSDALLGGGPPGLSRMDRDVLSQPGVRYIVLLLGTNDLFFGATAEKVIEGMRQVVARAHAKGIKVTGMTLLPRAGSKGWTPAKEAYRQQVNAWIRTSHTFDTVVDTDRVTANVYNGACAPDQMFPPFDSGDHLHPGPAGETAIANAVPPAVFGIPSVATLPPLVKATPTAGCAAAAGLVTASPKPSPKASPGGSDSASSPTSASGPTSGRPSSVPALVAAAAGGGVLVGVVWFATTRRRRDPLRY